MDISFYLLLGLACMVLLLAMWVCANANTSKWGPDLTLDLPPHLLQEAFFGKSRQKTDLNEKIPVKMEHVASAPCERPTAPLLSNEQPIGMTKPPLRSFSPSVAFNMDTAIRVLPSNISQQGRLKPVLYRFSLAETA